MIAAALARTAHRRFPSLVTNGPFALPVVSMLEAYRRDPTRRARQLAAAKRGHRRALAAKRWSA